MNRICTLIYSTVLCLFILTLGSNIGWVSKQCIFGTMLCRFDLFSNIHNHNIALQICTVKVHLCVHLSTILMAASNGILGKGKQSGQIHVSFHTLILQQFYNKESMKCVYMTCLWWNFLVMHMTYRCDSSVVTCHIFSSNSKHRDCCVW
jgi:hypothetical protein